MQRIRGVLAARNLSKSYGATVVLDRVSLVVSPGSRIGLVGPNGIGKSTLLRILAGIESPDAGTVSLESALEGFAGTVVLVTHDRRFLGAFRATSRLVFDAKEADAIKSR
jgi:macrolide transport system ATP-binding/permease protein